MSNDDPKGTSLSLRTTPAPVKTLRPLSPMVQTLRPRIPEIRKLKIGRKSNEVYTARSGREYRRPVKLDYFLVTKTTRYDDEDDENFEVDEVVMKELAAFADGDGHVRQIPARVGSDDIVDVIHSELACYVGETKVCWGDGSRAFRRLPIVQNGNRTYSKDVTERSCPCELLSSGRCKYKGRMIMKLDLPGLAMSGGAMIFRTTSQISLEESYGSLIDIVNDVGGLHGFRLWVVLRAARVAPEGRPTDVYVIHFENRESDLRALQRFVIDGRVIREQVRGTIDYKALVAATNEETPVESAEIATEFYPGSLDEEPHDLATGEVPQGGAAEAPAPTPAPAAVAAAPIEEPKGRGRRGKSAVAPQAEAPAASGVELDESTRKLYELQDEAARKAAAARSSGPSPEAAPGGEALSATSGRPLPDETPSQEGGTPAARPAEGSGAAREREPGDDDDAEPEPRPGTVTTPVPGDEPGQRSLLGESSKPAEPPRHGNAAMRNRLDGGSKR